MKTTQEILNERGITHGDFSENSLVSQVLKDAVRAYGKWNKLSLEKKEAIDMICHKIGRIMCGDPNFRDHWDDIAGYAKLASDRCKDD